MPALTPTEQARLDALQEERRAATDPKVSMRIEHDIQRLHSQAYDRRRREADAPMIRQGQAERAAHRFEELAGLWHGALDAVIEMLREMESIAREAEERRARFGVVATERPHPVTSPDRVALIAALRAARG